jgi:hypothetical protein
MEREMEGDVSQRYGSVLLDWYCYNHTLYHQIPLHQSNDRDFHTYSPAPCNDRKEAPASQETHRSHTPRTTN